MVFFTPIASYTSPQELADSYMKNNKLPGDESLLKKFDGCFSTPKHTIRASYQLIPVEMCSCLLKKFDGCKFYHYTNSG